MSNESRTPMAWLKSQRPDARRPWQGRTAGETARTAEVAKNDAKLAQTAQSELKRAVALPNRVLVNVLLD